MKKIIVTGAAGFIGSNLVAQLLAKNYSVVAIDNFDDTYDPQLKEENIKPFFDHENFILYWDDIRKLDVMRGIFKTEKPDSVIHLAAKADTREAVKNPYEYISVNVEGTLNILELAREFSISRVVIASSGSVYGNNPDIPWSEEANTDFPLSAYGATKKTKELLGYTYHHNFGMSVICLRYFNVYGENNRPNMVPYKWAKAFLTNSEIELSGEGTRKRDFTYVGDVVDATIMALQSELGYEVLNIGGSHPLSLKELLAVFTKVTGATPPIRKRPSHQASVNEMYADNSKAKKLLGWEPKVTIEEGVKRLVDWFRQRRLENNL